MLSLKDIDTRNSDFLTRTKSFCLSEFGSEWHVAILYGSYAKQIANTQSDLDILIVTDNINSARIKRIIKFIHQLHLEYQMKLDFEIPYEKKVCISRPFFEQACSGHAIFKEKKWLLDKIIPSQPLQITNDFMQRFLIGMMTNQHIFASGHYADYCKYKNVAVINILQAIFNILERKIIHLGDISQFMYSLKNVAERDLIGFRQRDPSQAYLTETLLKTIHFHPNLFKFVNNTLEVEYLGNNSPIEIVTPTPQQRLNTNHQQMEYHAYV